MKFVAYKEKKFYYQDIGATQKPCVLLLHGFGFTHTLWRDWLKHWGDDYRFLLPDMPGFGKSEFLPALEISDIAVIMQRILEEENVAKCTFVGHSMGGYVAASFAAQFPKYLQRLVMFHSSFQADDAEKKQVRQKAIDFMAKNGTKDFFANLFKNIFSKDFSENNVDVVSNFCKKAQSFDPESVIAAYHAMMIRPDLTAVLPTLTFPVIYLMGEEDTSIPLDRNVKELSNLLFGEALYYKNVAHMAILEKTEHSAQDLKQVFETTAYLANK
ncbi:MAG: alpha/beta hydrolase [Chitinophagales bacterium]|nr:alpha/beta hydrolase [Bacteroidota bacterium]MCB9044433.1 alpha/beta hydrolase [Chitinophagales bacterium]